MTPADDQLRAAVYLAVTDALARHGHPLTPERRVRAVIGGATDALTYGDADGFRPLHATQEPWKTA